MSHHHTERVKLRVCSSPCISPDALLTQNSNFHDLLLNEPLKNFSISLPTNLRPLPLEHQQPILGIFPDRPCTSI